MLDVVPPIVRNGGRGCLYTAEPADGRSMDRRPPVMFTFNAIARQSINAEAQCPRRVSTALRSQPPLAGYLRATTIVPCITEAQCPDWVSTASRSLLMVGRQTGAISADVYL